MEEQAPLTCLCLHCNQQFKPTKANRQKFCSKKCSHSHWVALNPQKCKDHQQTARDKKVYLCRRCSLVIPLSYRKGGRTHCSLECSREHTRLNNNKRHAESSAQFSAYKQLTGCCRCGYNKCGASMDFHHKDPTEKETELRAWMWKMNRPAFDKESEKCVLVCKNCHYELHDIFRRDRMTYWEEMELYSQENLK